MKRCCLLIVLTVAALVVSQSADVFAQKRPTKRAPKKTVETKTATKKPAASPVGEQQFAVAVTQIDFAGLKAVLKRPSENARPLLINFWATWCDPCREEFPELVKIDEEFRPRGLEFVTVSLDYLSEIKREVPKFLTEMRATMPAYLLKTADEDAAISYVAPDYRGALPLTVLYDPQGKIAYSRMGVVKPEILRAEIEKILKTNEPAAAK
jgi:thiol-disulfide isomerase/thioredoxin